MSAGPDTAPPRPDARRRRRVSVVAVLGELLITAGLVVLLFIAWQLWISEPIVGNELRDEASQQSREWNEAAEAAPPREAPDPPDDGAEPGQLTGVPVQAAPANATRFGMLIVPRWGADYYRPIWEGVGTSDVLNGGRLGHYPGTQMPGDAGNFALAAHRMGYGGSLRQINELQLGDRIYVETSDGWYAYVFRNLEFVRASGVGVLEPVPQEPGVLSDEHYITLTSCNPQHSTAERIIAYGLFDGFYPRDPSAPDFGAPAEIAATVNPGAAA